MQCGVATLPRESFLCTDKLGTLAYPGSVVGQPTFRALGSPDKAPLIWAPSYLLAPLRRGFFFGERPRCRPVSL